MKEVRSITLILKNLIIFFSLITIMYLSITADNNIVIKAMLLMTEEVNKKQSAVLCIISLITLFLAYKASCLLDKKANKKKTLISLMINSAAGLVIFVTGSIDYHFEEDNVIVIFSSILSSMCFFGSYLNLLTFFFKRGEK